MIPADCPFVRQLAGSPDRKVAGLTGEYTHSMQGATGKMPVAGTRWKRVGLIGWKPILRGVVDVLVPLSRLTNLQAVEVSFAYFEDFACEVRGRQFGLFA